MEDLQKNILCKRQKWLKTITNSQIAPYDLVYFESVISYNLKELISEQNIFYFIIVIRLSLMKCINLSPITGRVGFHIPSNSITETLFVT